MRIQFSHMWEVWGWAVLAADGTVTYEDFAMRKKGSLEKFVKAYAKDRGRKPDATFVVEMIYLLRDRTWAEIIIDEATNE